MVCTALLRCNWSATCSRLGVRRDIDLTFLEKGKKWMESAVANDQPFFLYFNHSNVHFPTLPRDEYAGSSEGGAVGDCIQMVDGHGTTCHDRYLP